MCWGLFLTKLQVNKIAGLKVCNFIKKEHKQRCFSVIVAKIFMNTYFEEHLRMNGSVKHCFQDRAKAEEEVVDFKKKKIVFFKIWIYNH